MAHDCCHLCGVLEQENYVGFYKQCERPDCPQKVRSVMMQTLFPTTIQNPRAIVGVDTTQVVVNLEDERQKRHQREIEEWNKEQREMIAITTFPLPEIHNVSIVSSPFIPVDKIQMDIEITKDGLRFIPPEKKE